MDFKFEPGLTKIESNDKFFVGGQEKGKKGRGNDKKKLVVLALKLAKKEFISNMIRLYLLQIILN